MLLDLTIHATYDDFEVVGHGLVQSKGSGIPINVGPTNSFQVSPLGKQKETSLTGRRIPLSTSGNRDLLQWPVTGYDCSFFHGWVRYLTEVSSDIPLQYPQLGQDRIQLAGEKRSISCDNVSWLLGSSIDQPEHRQRPKRQGNKTNDQTNQEMLCEKVTLSMLERDFSRCSLCGQSVTDQPGSGGFTRSLLSNQLLSIPGQFLPDSAQYKEGMRQLKIFPCQHVVHLSCEMAHYSVGNPMPPNSDLSLLQQARNSRCYICSRNFTNSLPSCLALAQGS